MIRRACQRPRTTEHCAKGGAGDFRCRELLLKNSPEFSGSGRMFSECVLPPGASVGMHRHTGELEVCAFLEGCGKVWSDGGWQPVGPGDVAIAFDGDTHSVVNTGDFPLRYIALILYA